MKMVAVAVIAALSLAFFGCANEPAKSEPAKGAASAAPAATTTASAAAPGTAGGW